MALLTRRRILHAAGVASAVVPLGLIAPRVLASSRPSSSLDAVGAPRFATCQPKARSPWSADRAVTSS
jgi:hypothetical protein